MGEIVCADIETNGLKPDEIFMVGVLDYVTDEFTAYTGERVVEGIIRLAEADAFIGHHILGFDVPVMEDLTGGLVKFDRTKLIDTLSMSREFAKGLPNHKMKTWGDLLGFPKLDPPPFDHFTEEMIGYCERDCRLNKMVFDILLSLKNDYQ